jgi:DNA mismatch repair protein MutL
MNRIRLLPEQVANQIAAGEVIERPASVVKELVENALDAQATRLTIEIQAGGRSLIRVIDDGLGMSRDDALLCLERHATSKIQKAEDLAAISTMGFRGEALPSIASVSRFTLTTRERGSDSPEATQVVVHGGRILEVKSAGHAPGTSVEVRQLFYNLPARRKFLRSEETERTHSQHYLTLAALAYPQVGFTFVNEQRLVWQLPPPPAGADRWALVQERLRALLGPDLRLLAVDHTVELADAIEAEAGAPAATLCVWGFIGAPGVSRATRQDQHLFVNRRPIENRALNYALLEGYHTSLMKGRYPVGCLFLELDPAEVDVNVHPSKREVKFRQEPAVRREVTTAVRQALLNHQLAGSATGSPARAGATGVPPAQTRPALAPGVSQPPREPASRPGPVTADLPQLLPPKPALATAPLRPPLDPAPARPTERPAPQPPRVTPQLPVHAAPPAPSRPNSAGAVPMLQVPLRLVGVIGNLYVVFESDQGLVLMDQHAAHERILFEQMLRRLEQGAAPSQRLLLPATVELSARDAQFVQEHLDVLVRLGVGLGPFGERTFLLDALPPFVQVADARRFVVDLIDELVRAGRELNALRLGEESVAKTVCRHAVKAHDPLSLPELERLLNDLRQCDMPYTCPHGRPTLIELPYRELEKKFGRVA